MKTEHRFPSSREIKRNLRKIYANADGSLDDISRLEPTVGRGLFRSLIIASAAVAVCAAAAFAGWWFFNSYAPAGLKNLVGDSGEIGLSVEAPTEIDSGSEIVYTIKYRNNKKVALNNLSLNVRYPGGLLISATEPAPKVADAGEAAARLVKEDNWDLGSLPKGASGEVKITGRLLAAAGSGQNIFVVLYYEPENFSSVFQKEATFATLIKSAPVAVTVDGPTQLATSDNFEFTVKYQSQQAEDLTNLLLEVKYPADFSLTSAEPAPVSGSQNQWPIAVLAKDAKGEIKIKGKFASTVTGSQNFLITTSQKEAGDNFFPLSEVNYTVTLLSGQLLVELKVNGSSDDGAVNFGDTLNYSLVYQNNSQETMKDLTAVAYLMPSADFVQWTSLSDRYDGTLDEFEAGQMITWTKAEVPNLDQLKAGERGVIDFSVKLLGTAGAMSGDLNLRSLGSLKVAEIGKEKINLENQSTAVTLKLNSNLALAAAARYFNDQGVSIGSGPIPPKVAETTSYVINWRLANTVHEVQEVKVSTVLPPGVAWGARREITVGDLGYDPTTRQVTWTINRLPTTVQLDYLVSFDVRITPAVTDAGKILALTGDNALTATDATTGAKISVTSGSLTTDLVSDPVAKGKGLVVE
ncbi:MAG: hypothetical protein WCT37_03160 [Patescibacteria group bacterium]|jgi:hypothetical protein